MRNRSVDMLSGSVTRGMLSMIIPIMTMNVITNVYNIVDLTFLKTYSSDMSVGAVGACSSLSTLCSNMLVGIAAGANVVAARHIGAGNRERADKTATTSVYLSVFGGLALAVIGVLFAETFLRWMNCHESLLPEAVRYFKMYFCGMPALMLYTFGASLLRSAGDTRRPMYISLLSGGVKVLLTYVSLALLDMGVAGVAAATVISNLIACALTFLTLVKFQNVLTVSVKPSQFSLPDLKNILRAGIPAGLQSSLYSFANVVITSTVNTFGPDATTGLSIANQFDGLLYQVCHAPSLAIAPYISQNVGAGNIQRVKKSLRSSVLITVAFGATLGTLSTVFSRQLAGIMSSTPAVIDYAQQKMVIVSSTYFICGINEVMSGALRGMDRHIVPTVATFVYMFILRIVWVYLVFPLCPNMTFLYTVWPIGWLLSIVTLSVFYIERIRKLQKQYA
ncbi:MAG: MATE family efflux transporter [Clostridia bacterium]|nr:MATE family efflux transporter [Clostridia bacterium]